MGKPARRPDESSFLSRVPAEGEIGMLVGSLGDSNGLNRKRARNTLVDLGQRAVPALIAALADRNRQVRWEAAKALGEISDPMAIDALLIAMDDREAEIRWLAEEALAAIGPQVLVSLLASLTQKADQAQFRAGAHHVLRSLREHGIEGVIHPVLEALEGVDPSVQAPIAAGRALVQLSQDNLRSLNREISGD